MTTESAEPQSKRSEKASTFALPERLYISLEDAAATTKIKVADLLHFGGLGKLRIVVMSPEGLEIVPFDTEAGVCGVPLFTPEMLALFPATCRRLECNGTASQGEFSRGYVFDLLGPLTQILPSYANPQFSGRWCYWKTFKGNVGHSLEIVPGSLFVVMSDLHAFLSGAYSEEEKEQEAAFPPREAFWSDALAFMMQASRKFWQGLGENDRGKFPKNEEVQAWLMDEGRELSLNQAKAAASLIRPKFAGTGRPSKE